MNRKLLNKSNIQGIQQQVIDQVGEYKEDDKLPVSIELLKILMNKLKLLIKENRIYLSQN